MSESRSALGAWLVVASGIVVTALAASGAWVGEDAHITFRTIDNWVHGHGLRWNVDERVQTYTHPLWMLINALAYALTREVYTTTTVLGLTFTLAAYTVFGWRLRERPWVVAVGWFAPLLLSQCFVRYGTSGFENSLSYALLAAFGATLLDDARSGRLRLARLLGLAALAAVTRLDTLLLYAPPLALLGWRQRGARPWRRGLLAISPALGWFGFATFYYGSPLPNTALAKLNLEIPLRAHLEQGVAYALELVAVDPVSFVALAFAVAWAVRTAARALGRNQSERGALDGLSIGIAGYVVYVIAIGGDFLSGRFWALPVLGAVMVAASELDAIVSQLRDRPRTRWLAAALGGGAVAIGVALAPALEREARERQILELPVSRKFVNASFEWEASPVASGVIALATAARAEAERSGMQRVTTGSAVGFSGFYSGPRFTIIDLHALTDPLLARLPPDPSDDFHIGHFARTLPAGYLHARRTGSLDRMEPGLAAYYRKLRRVTSAPLWSLDRLAAIVDTWLESPPILRTSGPATPSPGESDRR